MTTASVRRTLLIQGPPGPSAYQQVQYFLSQRASIRASTLLPVLNAGNLSVATRLQFQQAVTLNGVQFYWPGGAGALIVKASLWRADGTRLAFGTQNVNSAGIYQAAFTTPYLLVAPADLETDQFLTLYETSGTKYPSIGADADRPANPFKPGVYFTMCSDKWSVAGDAKPTTTGATSFALMDPLISPA